jgi:hypothetical protein
MRKILESLHEYIVHISLQDRKLVALEVTHLVLINNRLHIARILNHLYGVLLQIVYAILLHM